MLVVNCPSSKKKIYMLKTYHISSYPFIIVIILYMGNKQTGIHPTQTAVLLQMVNISIQTSIKVIRDC